MIGTEISAAYPHTQQRRLWQPFGGRISVPNMTKTDSKKAKPTEADIRAAARLKKLWLAMPRDRRPTQDQLADRYGEGGSQSLISQYMNGIIPLNLRAVLFFAREIGCDPHEIYPDLPGLDAIAGSLRARTAEPAVPYGELDEVDAQWAGYSLEQKRRILEIVKLAGVIGVTGTPRTAQKEDVGLKPSSTGAELRKLRRQRRKAPASGGKRDVS